MKPILLLDVDGVILLQRDGHNRMSTQHGFIDRDVAERLYELDGLFDIHWCTGWEHYANMVIAPLFGMEKKPVVELAKYHKGNWTPRPFYNIDDGDDLAAHDAKMNRIGNWKLPAVELYLDDFDAYHPVAWLDDQIGQTDVKRWAQQRPNTKLVQTYETRGLQEREMRMLVDFARLHRRPRQGGLLRRLNTSSSACRVCGNPSGACEVPGACL